MVPLINNAGATLRWFVEDVWAQFGDDHTRPGVPLLPSERKNADGPAARVGDEALRAALKEAARAHLPDWPGVVTPHVLRHFCASQLYLAGMDLIAIQADPRACLDRHHDELRPCPRHPCRGRVDRGPAARRRAAEGTEAMSVAMAAGRRPGGTAMKWNLRLAAANRGIWKASELQRMLAERDLVISAGKMSGLWSGDPASIKLSDLDVICAVLGCGVEELLIPEPDKVAAALGRRARPPRRPRRRDRRR